MGCMNALNGLEVVVDGDSLVLLTWSEVPRFAPSNRRGNVRIVKNTWTGSEVEVIVSLVSLEVVFELAH